MTEAKITFFTFFGTEHIYLVLYIFLLYHLKDKGKQIVENGYGKKETYFNPCVSAYSIILEKYFCNFLSLYPIK
jgi:hypothetical protein